MVKNFRWIFFSYHCVFGANPWYGYVRLTNLYFHDGRKACWARGDVTHFCLDNNWETNKDMSVNRERQFNSDSFSDNGKDPESGTTFPLDPFTTGRVWWCRSRSTVRPRHWTLRPRSPPPPEVGLISHYSHKLNV